MNDANFLTTLRAREAIERTLLRFALAQDEKDWRALEPLLTQSARAEYRSQDGVVAVDGRDQVIALQEQYLDACGPTQHLLSNLYIEVDGDTASSSCYVRAMHAGIGRQSGNVYDLWGRYCDTWLRSEGTWRICNRVELTFHRIGDSRSFFSP